MSRRARHGADHDYNTPWLLREFYGAPVWGMIAFGALVIGVGIFAFMHH
ncbi:MAG: hypothetical protein JSS74_17120 [Actinobacteria bacterium]|nr:hypothetical protein [Actinomycetota bacterium]